MLSGKFGGLFLILFWSLLGHVGGFEGFNETLSSLGFSCIFLGFSYIFLGVSYIFLSFTYIFPVFSYVFLRFPYIP